MSKNRDALSGCVGEKVNKLKEDNKSSSSIVTTGAVNMDSPMINSKHKSKEAQDVCQISSDEDDNDMIQAKRLLHEEVAIIKNNRILTDVSINVAHKF